MNKTHNELEVRNEHLVKYDIEKTYPTILQWYKLPVGEVMDTAPDTDYIEIYQAKDKYGATHFHYDIPTDRKYEVKYMRVVAFTQLGNYIVNMEKNCVKYKNKEVNFTPTTEIVKLERDANYKPQKSTLKQLLRALIGNFCKIGMTLTFYYIT
jgi:hypothetical protein